MIYSNQEASLDKTEQRDFMLAIKALLQDQKDVKRDEHHDRTKETLRGTSRHKISNDTARSPRSDADKSDPPATLRINSQNQVPLDPSVSESKLQPQGPESSAPLCAVQSPDSRPGTTNDKKDRPSENDPERVRPRERVVRPDPPEPNLGFGIHLFLIKPVVENFFDKVELTWLLQHVKMRDSAIYDYLSEQTYERKYVFDMLHTLHPYEKNILDGVIFGIDMSTEGSLLSLERTKTTICHRDITFTNVPGLQFVVRRERQYPDEVTIIGPQRLSARERTRESRREHARPREEPRIVSMDASYPIAGRQKARADTYGLGGGAPSQSPQDDIVIIDEVGRPSASRRTHSRIHRSRAATYYSEDDRPPPPQSREDASDSSGLEDQGYSDIEAEQEPTSLPEQDEDVVIDEMLKKYTTLFD